MKVVTFQEVERLVGETAAVIFVELQKNPNQSEMRLAVALEEARCACSPSAVFVSLRRLEEARLIVRGQKTFHGKGTRGGAARRERFLLAKMGVNSDPILEGVTVDPGKNGGVNSDPVKNTVTVDPQPSITQRENLKSEGVTVDPLEVLSSSFQKKKDLDLDIYNSCFSREEKSTESGSTVTPENGGSFSPSNPLDPTRIPRPPRAGPDARVEPFTRSTVPYMPESTPELARVRRCCSAYEAEAFKRFPGRAHPVRLKPGSAAYRKVSEAAEVLVAEQVSPEAWASWSFAFHAKYGPFAEKGEMPPVTAVFGAGHISKRLGHYRDQSGEHIEVKPFKLSRAELEAHWRGEEALMRTIHPTKDVLRQQTIAFVFPKWYREVRFQEGA